MDNPVSLKLTQLQVELRSSLVNEAVFSDRMREVFQDLGQRGLQITANVSENGKEFGQYGGLAGRTQTEALTKAVDPFQIRFMGGSSAGNTIQDTGKAKTVWTANIELLGQVFEEHWRARKASSGLWTAEDSSVSAKRKHTIEDAVLSGHPVAYVRLDCVGFGVAKQKLGGEEPGDRIIQAVSCFFRTKLGEHCLVFHPHGDEFELVFTYTRPRDVLARLAEFQDEFNHYDFRPPGHEEEVGLGIRMAVAFWANGREVDDPKSIPDILRAEADRVGFKDRGNLGFIEVAEQEQQGDGVFSLSALQKAVLWSRRGLALPKVEIFGDDLQDQVADWLVRDESGNSLTDLLQGLAAKFVIKTFSDTKYTPYSCPSQPTVSRYIPTARFAAIMLHVVLKRRFNGLGPVLPQGQVRMSVVQGDADRSFKLVMRQLVGEVWKEVLSYGPVQAHEPVEAEAGQPWVQRSADPEGSLGLLTKWVPAQPEAQSLSPCLAVLAGAEAAVLEPEVRPWAAGVIRIDDRPVTSGNLPDFWQSNLARIVVECLSNPNIRAIVLVRKNADTVKRTIAFLQGACRPLNQAETPANQTTEWSTDQIGQVASATTIRHAQLCHFQDREIQFIEIEAKGDLTLQTASGIILNGAPDLAARGDSDLIRWPSDPPKGSPAPLQDFKAARLSDVFPKILRALRHADTPRYVEPSGDELAELTGVRIQLDMPTADDLPAYWAPDRAEFDPYYQRAFAKGSLFGRRFCEWGAGTEGDEGVDQVKRAISETATAITNKHLTRRIMLVTAQPPGTTASDPLGLTSVHILPRFRSKEAGWFLDFLWVWRSVEAIVGFPFSAYGSVRFSELFKDEVNRVVPSNEERIRLGTVTYVAISLHLYCAPADLAIARHIDLEAQP